MKKVSAATRRKMSLAQRRRHELKTQVTQHGQEDLHAAYAYGYVQRFLEGHALQTGTPLEALAQTVGQLLLNRERR